ncbi:hypothetical protein APR41_08575 [Salegentibacter salinarum]|uniref:SGNH hydrolase-type esterase domain-containing protein n=1 Tax=Salegentibacter salinarum TaxID=447422 RepID=A0A2N0TNV5_9FLAO|nr:glycoside hydrolase family 76 protein [Salegentibacter salinarum]PKD16394.1 hypothetical protein APR41_08575 [Salegentibacter salinarum]SKB63521.1 Predicted alpha-1,6-mannanase, GH76 family [Salegentibacter salinarum]
MKSISSNLSLAGLLKPYLPIFILFTLGFHSLVFGKEKRSSAPSLVTVENNNKWSQLANSLQESTYKNYLGEKGVFIQDNKGQDKFHYWWNAHMVDILIDGYLRTKDKSYLPKIKDLVRGIKISNQDNFQIFFNDDMEWLGIACVRAYQATGDEEYKQVAEYLWEEIKKGWTEVHGGGIIWRTDTPEEKNACSNGPGALLALNLYNINNTQAELEWAKKIFEWQKNTLVDPVTGLVWDNISYQNAEPVINKELVLSYNQGTYIGAATQLFNHTGNKEYLEEAWKTTKSLITSPKLTYEGILRSEGQGDGGLFKGILVRNLTLLAENPSLENQRKESLLNFLTYNANTLITFGLDKEEMVVGPNWAQKPKEHTDLSTQLSGVMMMEMAARLDLKQKKIKRYCQKNDKIHEKPHFINLSKEEVVIAVLGSSTAEGIGPSKKENAWVPRFMDYLQKSDTNFKIINLAKGGFTTADLLPGGHPDKNISKALSYNPDAIIINLPSNDAAQGRSATDQIENYRKIFSSIKNEIPVWVTTPQPRNFEKAKVNIQKDMVDATYAFFDEEFIIDLWTYFSTEESLIKKEYDSGDGIHLNDEAHQLIFKRVVFSLSNFLKQA